MRSSSRLGRGAWIGRLVVAAAGMAALGWGSPAGAQIRWRTGTAPHSGRSQAEAVQFLAESTTRSAGSHLVVQFSAAVRPEDRASLEAAGVTLLSYLGDHAFFAAVEAERLDAAALASVHSLSDVQTPQRAWKQHPVFAAGETPDWAAVLAPQESESETWYGAYVLFHRDVALADGEAAVARHGARVRDRLESVNGLVIELPLGQVNALTDEDAVLYIEPALPRMSEVNDSNRVITQANTVQAAPYGLSGAGVNVLVYDGGTAAAGHADFGGRLFVRDASGTITHATHVAGTIGGNGSASSGTFRGMAPGVTMQSYGFQYDGTGTFLYTNPGDLESDYNQAINIHGAVISNNSIGTNTETNGFPCSLQGDYGVTDTVIDAIVRGSLGAPFRIVWANGNERQGSRCDVEGFGDYYSTAPPACAKNHVTVGAVNSNDDSMTGFSSWGPADDGRLKPDIAAPGCQSGGDGGVTSCSTSGGYTTLCGTSMASPTACGLAALLLEDFRAQFPGEPDFRNSTLKILFAHNAQDIQNVGPDYQTGYGSLRIQRTIDFMRTGNFLENQVAHGGTYSVLVPVANGTPQLKVTLAWDDPPGTPNVIPSLVNDLDLRVFDPSSNQHFPWTLDPGNPSAPAVRTQADHVNNIEQVVVDAPAAGTWRVEVRGFNVPDGPQVFSLCASPQIVDCSQQGVVILDQAAYGCADTVQVRVVDCDLNTDDGVIETVTVTVASDTEPGGETVLLSEAGPDTADFRGTINVDTTNSAGVVQVSPGDTLTATYIDADDGLGGTNVPVVGTASIDCQPPVISNVQLASVSSDNARITFATDELADGTIRYGLSCAALNQSVAQVPLSLAHSLTLTGLAAGTTYSFAVDAADAHGNSATDDNGGACYSFTTASVIHNSPLDANPGWSMQGQWAFGVPTGGGSSNRDPTSGFTGPNVLGYNLAGDYANNLPATYLTSTALDCSSAVGTVLRFRRWLGVESNSNFDEATVEASNNGTDWTVIFRATATGGDIADTSWQLVEYDISTIADGQPTVFIRWGMGPTDTSVTFPGWNLDDIQIVGLQLPLAITFPDGLPATLPPGAPETFRVRIQPASETYVPGSGVLRYRYGGGAFQSAPLAPLGGDLFEATLPATVCASTPQFYVSAQGSGGGTAVNPPSAPLGFHSALVGELITVMADNFETNQGWTVGDTGDNATTGIWVRVDPVGTLAQPEDDHTPAPGVMCFVTGQGVVGGGLGDNDVDNGKTTLKSPLFDASGAGATTVSYWRWYSNDTGAAPNADVFKVDISNDGGVTWVNAETVGPAGPETHAGWFYHEFEVADVIAPTDQMRMRFVAADEGSGSLVEAAVDDFLVSTFSCEDVGVPPAVLTAAVSRKSNPAGPGGVCDLALIPGVASEPRQGGISEVRLAFDIAPGVPGAAPVSIEQRVCPPPGSYVAYSGAAVVSGAIAGNELVLSFAPSLENGVTYRLTVGPEVSSVGGQSVEVRGLLGDVNADGAVNALDRSVVIGAWTGSGFSCGTDVSNDGTTNAIDRSLVIGAWTGAANCAP